MTQRSGVRDTLKSPTRRDTFVVQKNISCNKDSGISPIKRLQLNTKLNGLRYGDLNVTFFYGVNRTFTVANHTIAGFYQGLRKTAHKTAVVRTRGMPWEDAFKAVSSGLTVDFVVELATTVKLRRCGFYMKRKTVVAAADVRVDGSGEDAHQKAIRLR